MTSDDSEDANSRPIRENGQRHLGTFATPEEAALCYARHIGAERSAAELAQARVAVPRPLTADEARAAAVAEGRELLPSSGSESGYKGVVMHYGKYQARIEEKGNLRHLGTFATPEEAALCYARHVRDLVDGWLIPGPRPSHRPPSEAPVPAPPTPCEVEQAEALTSMRDDQRQQQGSPSSLPAATTEHASRERLATAVAFAEVVLQGAVAFQPQLSAESGDDPGAARCVICLEALDLSAASSRGETACGHTPCCGNYFHKHCLSQWLQGSGQSDERLPIERIEKKCPMCRREQLVALPNLEERLVALPNLEEGLVAPLPNLEEQLVARALLPVPRAVAVVHSEAAASATTSKSGRKRRAVAVDGEAEAQARLRELEDELEEEEMLALETALGVKRVPSAAAFVAALKAWESPEERPEQPSAQNSALASEGRGKK